MQYRLIKKILLLINMPMLSCATVFAQKSVGAQMDDTLRSSGKIYVVVTTLAIIFVGLAIYLFSIDRRLKKIEKRN
jgi:CcmD family protein